MQVRVKRQKNQAAELAGDPCKSQLLPSRLRANFCQGRATVNRMMAIEIQQLLDSPEKLVRLVRQERKKGSI